MTPSEPADDADPRKPADPSPPTLPATDEPASTKLRRAALPPVPVGGRLEGADEAWTMVAELVSAVVTWAGIGWLLDRWLDTQPALLLIGIVIGTVAGFYLVVIRHNRMIAEMGPPYGQAQRERTPPERMSPDFPTIEGRPRGTD